MTAYQALHSKGFQAWTVSEPGEQVFGEDLVKMEEEAEYFDKVNNL